VIVPEPGHPAGEFVPGDDGQIGTEELDEVPA
jgi:hypothetical protein